MATPTLAKSPQPEQDFTGALIQDLVRTVERVEKPKPPQPAAAQPATESESDMEQERRLRG
jgi:hypothetical protein